MASNKRRPQAAKAASQPTAITRCQRSPPPALIKRDSASSLSSLSSISEEMLRTVDATPVMRGVAAAEAMAQMAQGERKILATPAKEDTTEGARLLKERLGDVTLGEWNENMQSPLMRLPRSIRDRIYAHLLTACLSKTKDALLSSLKPPKGDYRPHRTSPVQISLIRDQRSYLPGGSESYPTITQSMGLLLSCKQLHAEANAYLYSQNTFMVKVESEQMACFWTCGNEVCREDVPCLVHVRNIRQIKHLHILAYNPHAFEDGKAHDDAARHLALNLRSVARVFKELDIRLETLKIRYLSCLEGQYDSVRKEIDALPKPGKKAKYVILRSHGGGRGYCMKQGGSPREVFKNVTIFDALKLIAGIAGNVTVVGDLPTSYITSLTRMLTTGDGMAVKIETEVVERAQAKRRSKCKRKEKEALWRRRAQEQEAVWRKREQNQEMETARRKREQAAAWQRMAVQDGDMPRDLCENMLSRPIYSAVVMREMLGQASPAQLAWMGRFQPL